MSIITSLSSSIRRAVNCSSLLPQFQKLSINPQGPLPLLPVCATAQNLIQQRFGHKNLRIKRKRRHTKQPFWHAQVTRTLYPEHVTPENEEFLEEYIEEQYSEKQESLLDANEWTKGEWNSKSQRVGLVGKKIGIYPMWLKNGTRILTTLIHISDNHVIKHVPYSELVKNDFKGLAKRSKKPRGALIVGADSGDPRMFTKEYFNMFEEAGVRPKKKLTKFLVTDNAVLPPGTPLFANHFRPGDSVDVSNYSIDRGFQGVVVRWGFRGGPAEHGCTKSHRRPGYIGYGAKRGVMKGKKMPGHMGMEYRTMRGCKIVRVNSEFQCIWLMGCSVPGATGSYVNIYDSGLHHNRHRAADDHPPFPTHFAEDPIEKIDWHWDKLHAFTDDTIVFEEAEAAAK